VTYILMIAHYTAKTSNLHMLHYCAKFHKFCLTDIFFPKNFSRCLWLKQDVLRAGFLPVARPTVSKHWRECRTLVGLDACQSWTVLMTQNCEVSMRNYNWNQCFALLCGRRSASGN